MSKTYSMSSNPGLIMKFIYQSVQSEFMVKNITLIRIVYEFIILFSKSIFIKVDNPCPQICQLGSKWIC